MTSCEFMDFLSSGSSLLIMQKLCFVVLIISIISQFQIIEQSGVFTAEGLKFTNSPAVLTTAVGQMVCYFCPCRIFKTTELNKVFE